MEASQIELFQTKVSFARLSPLKKLLTHPAHMLRSKWIAKRAANRPDPTPIRVRTFWGGEINLLLPESVSVSIERYGFHEEGLTAILLNQLHPGMTFFDIGAHFGYFTLLAAHLVGPSGHVHSFDPTPRTFDLLSKNVVGAANIKANRVAVFSRADTLVFKDFGPQLAAFNSLGAGNFAADDPAAKRFQTYTVSAITLDDYVARTGVMPDLIKIDAEGAELEILKGCEHLLTERRPTFTLEVGDFKGASTDSSNPIHYLMDRGYKPWQYHDGKIVPHEIQTKYTYDNLLMIPQ